MAPALLENIWRVTGRRGSARGGLGDPVHIPPTLKGLDPCFIDEWADGWFTVDGLSVALDGRSPLDVADAPPGWHEAVHGFGWLVDVPMAPEDELTTAYRDLTRDLVADWLKRGSALPAVAHRLDVTARRVISFLAHSDVVLENASARLFDRFSRQIARDTSALMAGWHGLDDEGRVLALTAIAQAGLACDGGGATHARAEMALLSELDRQILTDGGHLSRDPRTVPALLLDLIPLRQLYVVAGSRPSPAFTKIVTAMTTFASAMRLGDGQLTRLSAVRSEHDIVLPPLTLLGLPPDRWTGAASGFARISAGATVLLVDAGSDRRPSGALAFEWSAGDVPVVVCAGAATGRMMSRTRRPVSAAATADRSAQSTLVIEGVRQIEGTVRTATPSLSQRQSISVETIEGVGTRIDATHAGYAVHGFAHRRVIDLSPDGRKISGQDTLRPLVGPASERAAALAFHFQLHPDVAVEPLPDVSAVRLTLRDGTSWRFEVMDGRISIEDDVTIVSGRAVPSIELVVRAAWPEKRTLNWVFEAL